MTSFASAHDRNFLAAYWQDACTAAGVLLTDRDHPEIFDGLIAAYSDPARGYHNLRHLVHVIARLGTLSADGGPKSWLRTRPTAALAIPFALFYHDIVYHTDGPASEEASAVRAEEELSVLGVNPDVIAEVGRLIRLTAAHDVDPEADILGNDGDVAGALVCDADLHILAADPADYIAYVTGVRFEYSNVSDDDWRAGRTHVLTALLRNPVFRLPGQQREQSQARANMHWELALLAAGVQLPAAIAVASATS